jgi:hypothetical protein
VQASAAPPGNGDVGDVSATQDGVAAAYCVDGCLTLHYALAEYGISSRVEALLLRVEGNGSHTLYGDRQGPCYNANGTSNGHAVLVTLQAGRFLDPTIQQYAEVPRPERGMLPLLSPLPIKDGLGDQPLERLDDPAVQRPRPGVHGRPDLLSHLASSQFRKLFPNR